MKIMPLRVGVTFADEVDVWSAMQYAAENGAEASMLKGTSTPAMSSPPAAKHSSGTVTVCRAPGW